MEILIPHTTCAPLDAAVFDFDGTLSGLRAGWENVMGPLMCRLIPGEPEEVRALVSRYIDESTGLQTIHQMRWLAGEIERRGGHAEDPWAYKDEYNRRLMVEVGRRRQAVISGSEPRSRYTVAGAECFLSALREEKVRIFAASGTDEPDVVAEAEALGLSGYFDGIYGSRRGSELCSKEAVLKTLVKTDERLFVAGDGKVEIALGREAGALTLGLCTDDIPGDDSHTVDPAKRRRLAAAGAHALVPDFASTDEILSWM